LGKAAVQKGFFLARLGAKRGQKKIGGKKRENWGKGAKKRTTIFCFFLGGRKKTEELRQKIALPNQIAALPFFGATHTF
jgi:hypothetical protein